jgi:hypothetical protein
MEQTVNKQSLKLKVALLHIKYLYASMLKIEVLIGINPNATSSNLKVSTIERVFKIEQDQFVHQWNEMKAVLEKFLDSADVKNYKENKDSKDKVAKSLLDLFQNSINRINDERPCCMSMKDGARLYIWFEEILFACQNDHNRDLLGYPEPQLAEAEKLKLFMKSSIIIKSEWNTQFPMESQQIAECKDTTEIRDLLHNSWGVELKNASSFDKKESNDNNVVSRDGSSDDNRFNDDFVDYVQKIKTILSDLPEGSLKNTIKEFKDQINRLSSSSSLSLADQKGLKDSLEAVNDCFSISKPNAPSSSQIPLSSSSSSSSSSTSSQQDTANKQPTVTVDVDKTKLANLAKQAYKMRFKSIGWKILGGLMIGIGVIVAGLGGLSVAAGAGLAIPTFGLSVPTLGSLWAVAVAAGTGLIATGTFWWKSHSLSSKMRHVKNELEKEEAKKDNMKRRNNSL